MPNASTLFLCKHPWGYLIMKIETHSTIVGPFTKNQIFIVGAALTG